MNRYFSLACVLVLFSFVSPSFADQEETTVLVVTQNTIIFSAGSTKSIPLGEASVGDEFVDYQKSGDWYMIKFQQKTGWIPAAAVKEKTVKKSPLQLAAELAQTELDTVKEYVGAKPKPSQPTRDDESALQIAGSETEDNPADGGAVDIEFRKAVKVTAGRLNVRAAPSATARVLGVVTQGEVLQMRGKSGNWYEILFQGHEAWISSSHATEVAVAEPIIEAPNEQLAPAANVESNKTTEPLETESDNLSRWGIAPKLGVITELNIEPNFWIALEGRYRPKSFDHILFAVQIEYFKMTLVDYDVGIASVEESATFVGGEVEAIWEFSKKLSFLYPYLGAGAGLFNMTVKGKSEVDGDNGSNMSASASESLIVPAIVAFNGVRIPLAYGSVLVELRAMVPLASLTMSAGYLFEF